MPTGNDVSLPSVKLPTLCIKDFTIFPTLFILNHTKYCLLPKQKLSLGAHHEGRASEHCCTSFHQDHQVSPEPDLPDLQALPGLVEPLAAMATPG